MKDLEELEKEFAEMEQEAIQIIKDLAGGLNPPKTGLRTISEVCGLPPGSFRLSLLFQSISNKFEDIYWSIRRTLRGKENKIVQLENELEAAIESARIYADSLWNANQEIARLQSLLQEYKNESPGLF